MKIRRITAASAALTAFLAMLACSAPAHAQWIWTPETGWRNADEESLRPAREQYEVAMGLYRAGDYEEAAEEFALLARLYPDAELAEEGQFLLAESHYEAEAWYEAYNAYTEYLGHFPRTKRLRHVIERQMAIARRFLDGEKRPSRIPFLRVSAKSLGVRILDRIVVQHPYEDFSDDCVYILAGHFESEERWEEAVEEYRRLLREYPGSEWAPVSQYRLAECLYSQDSGLHYDKQAMAEARRQYELYVSRHPDGRWVEQARARITEIRETIAEKDYDIARYYERAGQKQAAIEVHRTVIREHPTTSWADKSRERLQDLLGSGMEGVEPGEDR